MRRGMCAVTIIAVVALGAGCGGTRSTGGNRTAATTARTKALKFAECMRANGADAFPDPDASGRLTIDAVANGSSVDTT